MAETFLGNPESRAHQLMEQKLGAEGMALLNGQLERWQELNERPLLSPLRDALKRGDTRLPKGTLLHGMGMHSNFDGMAVRSVAEKGILSGELLGIVEDAETNGCADFFRTSVDTTIADYVAYAKQPAIQGNLKTKRGEHRLLSGVTFIVDPQAEGMEGLTVHDGYKDPAMQTFINPPSRRTAEDTAAILGGVPRGAIAGILAGDKLLADQGIVAQLGTLFEGVPILNHAGVLQTPTQAA